jgi:hypothetical protein
MDTSEFIFTLSERLMERIIVIKMGAPYRLFLKFFLNYQPNIKDCIVSRYLQKSKVCEGFSLLDRAMFCTRPSAKGL